MSLKKYYPHDAVQHASLQSCIDSPKNYKDLKNYIHVHVPGLSFMIVHTIYINLALIVCLIFII